jgi:hypothetical protein
MIWDEEVPMVWTHYEGSERTIGAPADADLCHVMRGERAVHLATRINPFSMPNALAAGTHVVVFLARGQEADSARLCVELTWDGLFDEDEAKMAQHLRVRPTADPALPA